jgi:negative regulator of sigma E activity
VAVKRVRYRWRDEYERDPEYQRILARLELPWWKRPVVQVAVVASAAAFVVGALIGSAQDRTDSPSPSSSNQVQSQNDKPAGLTYQQKQQILFKFCTSDQMRGPVGDSSAFPTCMGDYYVTDQGMVMPK